MGILNIGLKTLVSMIILFALTRFMGKKQISRMTYFDYVAGITVGSITAGISTTSNLLPGLISLLIWALFPIVLSLISLMGNRARRLLEGEPSILIYEGKILPENLRKAHMNIDELMERCRIQKAYNIDDVKMAVMETNGKFSLLKKASFTTITPKHMDMQMPYKGPSIELFMDGRLLKDNLEFLHKDEAWFLDQIAKNDIHDITDLVFAFVDSNGRFYYNRRSYSPDLPHL